MNITKELLDDHQLKLSIEIDVDQFESAKRKAARKIAKGTKIPGFRPGKAPYEVITRHVGEALVVEEAVDLVLDDVYPQAIEEAEITPYGPGNIQEIPSLEPPTFIIHVPLAPEVDLKDYKDTRLDYSPPETVEEDIDAYIEQFREQVASLEIVNRPIEAGDIVVLNINGKFVSLPESEEEKLMEQDSYTIQIPAQGEADDQSEWPFPGFANLLVGHSENDEKTISYTFPEDYEENETWRGFDAEFYIIVEEVKTRQLPDLDNEFAEQYGEFEDLSDMRTKLGEMLQENSVNKYNGEFEDQVLTAVIEGAEFKYPPQMLDDEVSLMVTQLEDRLEQYGMSMDVYMTSRSLDQKGLLEELRPEAEQRLKRSLVIMEIANQEKIEVESDEVQAATSEAIDSIFRSMPERKARKMLAGDALKGIVSRIATNQISEKTLEYLRLVANGQWEIMEAEKAAEAEAEAAKEEKLEPKDIEQEPQSGLAGDSEDEEPDPGDQKIEEENEPDEEENVTTEE